MKLSIFQIDAFATRTFEGNPAAVVPLEAWLPDKTLQAIAEENNLAETAFFVADDAGYHLRWFTPNKEVKLCGHATLASAYVIFNILKSKQDSVVFSSLSGALTVTRQGDMLTLDFPKQEPTSCELPALLSGALGRTPVECLATEDYLAVFETEEEVLAIEPDHLLLKQLDRRGVIISAPSSTYDFVSRFFAPKYGIPEDSVTGSAHTILAPYWSRRLGKTELRAKQVSSRGGELVCVVKEERVLISGYAVQYLEGTIAVDVPDC